MPPTASPLALNNLPPGTRAKIEGFAVGMEGSARVQELGMLPGAVIEVIRVAPLGDPIQVKIGESLFSIRKEEARGILVRAS